MNLAGKILCRSAGVIGMGVALYDACHVANHRRKVCGEIAEQRHIEKVYYKWLKEYAIGILTELVKKYQTELKKYNIKVPKIEIRQMKSRWGSCLPSNNKVIFN